MTKGAKGILMHGSGHFDVIQLMILKAVFLSFKTYLFNNSNKIYYYNLLKINFKARRYIIFTVIVYKMNISLKENKNEFD